MIFSHQPTEAPHIFRPGILTGKERRIAGRCSCRPHHFQPFVAIPFQEPLMGGRRGILIFPTHIHTFFREKIDGLIQLTGVPNLSHFFFRLVAQCEFPETGIFKRHIIPEYRNTAMIDSETTNFLQPDHLKFKSRLTGCLTTVVDTDRGNFVSPYMQIFAIRHGFQGIQI